MLEFLGFNTYIIGLNVGVELGLFNVIRIMIIL